MQAIFKPATCQQSEFDWYELDLPSQPSIQAHYSNVLGVIRGTTRRQRQNAWHTIEHMLSAVYALGIDNLDIELVPTPMNRRWPMGPAKVSMTR